MVDRSEAPTLGQVGLALRIGVTGHRVLPSMEQVNSDVDAVIARILELQPQATGPTPRSVTVVSALAEGSDRLVALAVLHRPGTRLEAVLPRPEASYELDFETHDSKSTFRELLEAAAVITVVRSDTKEQGYERAGYEVVDRCDVLVAVWDGVVTGIAAGTSGTVRYARKAGKPTFWVHSTGGGGVTEEVGGDERPINAEDIAPISLGALERLDAFNDTPVKHIERDSVVDLSQPATAELASKLAPNILGPVLDWATPYYTRANREAVINQSLHRRSSWPMFLLSAAAVAAVAAQLTILKYRLVVLGEIVFLSLVLVLLELGRRRRWHDRWISSRYLAEWIRSAVFLALIGTHDRQDRDSEGDVAVDPTAEWLQRAFTEIWLSRPQLELTEADAAPLRWFLAENWIEEQRRYHDRTGHRHERLHKRYQTATEVLFGLGLVVAVAHLIAPEGSLEHVLGFLAVVLPVSAAAITGFSAQREYKRHADRYTRMSVRLERLRTRMEAAQDLEHVRQVASETERLMREESGDWFGVVRLHDVELPF